MTHSGRRLTKWIAALIACCVTGGMLAAPAVAQPRGGSTAGFGFGRGVPFTSATVTRTSGGNWDVSWTTPHTPVVAVFTGPTPQRATRLVGIGGGTDDLIVSASPSIPLAWFRLVPVGGTPITISERDLGLVSDRNLRDVGGYRTIDGDWVRMGQFYRSEALTLSPSDLAVVDSLRITADYDLRTPGEVATAQDIVPAGASYTLLNVYGVNSLPSDLPPTPDAARADMLADYRGFVTGTADRQAFGTLLTRLARAPGAQLFHCSSGKDRTGWAAAILLLLLGVPESTVMQDYLLSNEYVYHSPEVQAMLASVPPPLAAIFTQFVIVTPEYLEAGLDQMTASYGSLRAYLIRGLGLSPRTIELLKARLLIPGPARA